MNKYKNKGFTLTELLTVVGIIAVLVALLLPALRKVRTVSFDIRQRGQINAIEIALEAYKVDFGTYPNSSNTDADGDIYYGSEKLAEALLGYDILGVHKDVRPSFDKDDDNAGLKLYSNAAGEPINLEQRKGPYLEADRMNPVPSGSSDIKYKDIFDLDEGGHYLADSYRRSGLKVGLPILYYRANLNSKTQNISDLIGNRVYDYRDSNMVFDSGLSGEQLGYTRGFARIWGTSDGTAAGNFNDFITNPDIPTAGKTIPYRAQSFLLITAGADGIYGTADDICNFGHN